jgi:hypothetical protein
MNNELAEALIAFAVVVIGSLSGLTVVWIKKIQAELERNTRISSETRGLANGTLANVLTDLEKARHIIRRQQELLNYAKLHAPNCMDGYHERSEE